MLISKVTVGFVIQTFDQSQDRFTSQEFVAGDEVTYEDDNGEVVDSAECEVERGDVMSEPYIGFEMLQPTSQPRATVDNDLQLALCTVVDLANQNALDQHGCDEELKEECQAQNDAINAVVKMLDELRRQRDNMPTQEVKPTDQSLTAYQQVISELASDSEGNIDLLNQALDAMRMEAIQVANAWLADGAC
jgi:hypothetical protein